MWLLPSLNRPGSLRRFFDAYRATGGSTPGAVIVDHADFAANEAEYRALDLPAGWFVWRTAGITQGDKLREIWERLAPCAWLGLIGDDCVPETWEWDKRLVECLDGTNFVSCDDDWQAPQRVANCWAISGKLLRTIDYIFPPGLHHLFIDDVWEVIGRATGSWQIRMDVRVRHQTVRKGAAPPDDTHRKVYGDGCTPVNPAPDKNAGLWAADEKAFGRWRVESLPGLITAVTTLRKARAATGNSEEQARLDRLRSRTVMICTPIARAPVWQYTLALAETCVLLQGLGIRFYFASVAGMSNLPRARNILAARFLSSDATDLMFIDDDIGWDQNDVVRLLASDQPLIAGVVRKKSDNSHDIAGWCCEFFPDATQELRTDALGNIEVARVGTGFMRIQRRVFEVMMRRHPELKRSAAAELPPAEDRFYHRFFHFNDDELTEDFVFCDRWRAAGGRVFIDPSLKLTHVGEKAYTGAITELIGSREAQPVGAAATGQR